MKFHLFRIDIILRPGCKKWAQMGELMPARHDLRAEGNVSLTAIPSILTLLLVVVCWGSLMFAEMIHPPIRLPSWWVVNPSPASHRLAHRLRQQPCGSTQLDSYSRFFILLTLWN
ncbi:hypothetical protein J6590_016915 [Homalodisca vitripennis]|nr:hypothetical protein J6590_016915 [Homalodisca vitripennis]